MCVFRASQFQISAWIDHCQWFFFIIIIIIIIFFLNNPTKWQLQLHHVEGTFQHVSA